MTVDFAPSSSLAHSKEHTAPTAVQANGAFLSAVSKPIKKPDPFLFPMSNTQIVTQEHVAYSEEQRRLITDVLCKGASETEVEFFMEVSKRCRLDPFRKQIHAVKRWDATLQREALSFQVGIDGLRAIASRTGEYVGNDEPAFELDAKGNPIKASCTVYRLIHGQRYAFTASVFWAEYAQKKKDGSLTKMWYDRPFGQLGKCAEAAALRKAFPEESGGLYTEEELDSDDTTIAPNARTVVMPTVDEVKVTPTPTTQPKDIEAETLEVVKPELTQEEMDVLDFIAVINEYTKGNGLTRAVNEQLSSFKEPHKAKVKAAIFKRSKELGLVWNVEAKAFQPLA